MSFAIVFTLLCSLTPQASRVKVAVIEYRTGVSEQSDLSGRVVSLLQARSNLDIITANDGRRMLGAGFDLMISKCKASPYCLSRLGQKLKAHEVLLIALTEFGNVIISMNRIVVHDSVSKGSADLDVQPGGRVTKIQIYKMLRKIFPRSYFKQWGNLKIRSNISGAGVFLNKKSYGSTPLKPLRLPAPNKYRIRVTKTGYVPFTAAIDLTPRANLSIDATLNPLVVSNKKTAWYKKWWVWTAVGVVVVTSATVTYMMTRPPSSVPLTLEIH
ncbi:PEGA domain-containing protein [Myxococcota bacterium]|nr:PEGA domain-containing protein [Myxococcota bacterium]MBU1537871.1 PEGA domain-containing protein [Myxococcota bacterium]